MEIVYAVERTLSVEAFRDILVRSTLGERRPVDEPERLATMLAQADVIITARQNGKLVGVSRAVTDFSFCCYLSDLAVDEAYQHRGIGKALVARTHQEAGLHTTLILLAAPKAVDYYGKIGMTKSDVCWIVPRNS